MDKIKNVSIKRSMTLTFIITICMIGVFSGITIFMANQFQQEILRNKYLMVKSPDYELDKSINEYTVDMDGSVVEKHGLNMAEKYRVFWVLFCNDWLAHSLYYRWHWKCCCHLLSYETESSYFAITKRNEKDTR